MPENLEKHGNLIEERAVFLLRSILPEAQDPLLLYIHMFLLEDLRIGSMLYEYGCFSFQIHPNSIDSGFVLEPLLFFIRLVERITAR